VNRQSSRAQFALRPTLPPDPLADLLAACFRRLLADVDWPGEAKERMESEFDSQGQAEQQTAKA
jgi:hypothetical protein